jgi:hypothetical protein
LLSLQSWRVAQRLQEITGAGRSICKRDLRGLVFPWRQTNEFRRHPRISAPKGTILAWRSGFARQVSRIGNLSLGGLYIRTTEPPPTGAVIQLLLNVPAGEVRARAVVQWSEPMKGVGVKFVAMQQEDHARFATWLKQLSS